MILRDMVKINPPKLHLLMYIPECMVHIQRSAKDYWPNNAVVPPEAFSYVTEIINQIKQLIMVIMRYFKTGEYIKTTLGKHVISVFYQLR